MARTSRRQRLGACGTAATAAIAVAAFLAGPAAHAANPQITVDLSSSQGPVTYGASGSLYALSP